MACRYRLRFYVCLLLLLCCWGFSFKPAFQEKPEANRFTKVVLARNLDEPMQFEVLPDGRVLLAERKGKLKVFYPNSGKVEIIADIPVRHLFEGISAGGTNESEDGIQGVLLDPDYARNKYIYVYYAPLAGEPRNVLSRFTWNGGQLDRSTEKVLLQIPVDPTVCCHIGGGMVFDRQGNLLLATGENGQAPDGYSTIDERPGHSTGDAQRTAANTNDLRGKILRIHPEPDGTYSIPAGNLFPVGTPKTRPEIYTMGNRNPWRLSVDHQTGWLYWGEVGPNGSADSPERGPRAYDEFNQARQAGNFGYPHFVGNNKAYRRYDFATGTPGAFFDPANPINQSPNNTGQAGLPPAQPAFIWYPYGVSAEFPQLGSGGMSAVGGPVYRRASLPDPARPFPPYYEGKWFITDWVRGWIMAVSMDAQGNFAAMERFLPDMKLYGAIDMDFGPEGDLYLLEYGTGVFKTSPEAQLVRIEYNKGNRPPLVKASASKTAGTAPLQVRFSARGSSDYDGDKLSYEWRIGARGKVLQVFRQADPVFSFTRPGRYRATLQVKDSHGATSSKTIVIEVGNEPPVVWFDFKQANKSFYFPGNTIRYAVQVRDQEDGSLQDGKISASRIALSMDYLPEGRSLQQIRQLPWQQELSLQAALARQLIGNSDCRSCHTETTPAIGPAYTAIAHKYRDDPTAQDRLAKKVIAGGSKAWGDQVMPAHPMLSEADAHTIVRYILSLQEKQAAKVLPLSGSFTTTGPENKNDKGFYVFRAAYTDKGTQEAPACMAEERVLLRNALVPVARVDQYHEVAFNRAIFLDKSDVTAKKPGAYLALNQIDLTGIRQIFFTASVLEAGSQQPGWYIEVRVGSPAGRLIGQTPPVAPEKEPGREAKKLSAPISATPEVQDVYFVLANNASEGPHGNIKVKDIRFSQD